MRFLIDNALSPAIADALRAAGHDAAHVRDDGIQGEADEVIFNRAAAEERVVVSADTDFGALLLNRRASRPSVILFRHGIERQPHRQAALLLENLPDVVQALEEGAVVALEPPRTRIRSLPLAGPDEAPRLAQPPAPPRRVCVFQARPSSS